MSGDTAPALHAIDVAAGVIFSHGRVLLAQRRPQDHLGGLWEFPGGKREPGESWERCLERELLEELGILVKVCGMLDCVTHSYPQLCAHIRFFRCEIRKSAPQPLGCQAIAWASPEELAGFAFPPADAQFLEKLGRTREWWQVTADEPSPGP